MASEADREPERTSALRVEIDARVCIGSGLCAGLAPEHFGLTPDDTAQVLNVESADPAEMRAVSNCCPSGAIIVSGD